jgi:TolA-binding protein
MAKSTYILAVFALTLLVVAAMAQSGAQDRAAQLRAQLADVQAQQTALQARLDQINEDIKPENIERSLAGVGSTHPEDLREARRRQLETQRQGLQRQLDNLAATRARLETAIAAADAQSYRETVGPNASAETTATPKSNETVVKRTVPQKHRVKKRRQHRRRQVRS